MMESLLRINRLFFKRGIVAEHIALPSRETPRLIPGGKRYAPPAVQSVAFSGERELRTEC